MSIVPEYISLAELVAAQIELPSISRLYLPQRDENPEVRDEFALLFLDNGVVAPFYASLPGTLDALWQAFPPDRPLTASLIELVQLLKQPDPAQQAIALGACNALGQHVMRLAGLLPLANKGDPGLGSAQPRPGERVGMIGYFCPLIDKLTARGVEVLVVEKQPERVEPRPGVVLSQNPRDLASCRIVLCTAATLINDTIDDILSHCRKAQNFSLIGPSGSGLPDALFARGVDSVGGVFFADHAALAGRLRDRDSWGSAGEKYQLTPDNYPGIENLLARITKDNALN